MNFRLRLRRELSVLAAVKQKKNSSLVNDWARARPSQHSSPVLVPPHAVLFAFLFFFSFSFFFLFSVWVQIISPADSLSRGEEFFFLFKVFTIYYVIKYSCSL